MTLTFQTFKRYHHPPVISLSKGSAVSGVYQELLCREYAPSESVIKDNHFNFFVSVLRSVDTELLGGLRFFCGQSLSYGIHRFLPVDSKYVALLEHPLEFLAGLYLQLHGPSEMSFPEFVSKHRGALISQFIPDPVESLEPNILAKASRVLDRDFLLVGAAEQFAQYSFLLGELLGWQSPRFGIFEKDPDVVNLLSELDVNMVADFNRSSLDVQLYHAAQSRCDALLELALKTPSVRTKWENYQRNLTLFLGLRANPHFARLKSGLIERVVNGREEKWGIVRCRDDVPIAFSLLQKTLSREPEVFFENDLLVARGSTFTSREFVDTQIVSRLQAVDHLLIATGTTHYVDLAVQLVALSLGVKRQCICHADTGSQSRHN